MSGAADELGRWAWAEIDLEAIEHNVRVLQAVSSPAAVWAVVKADGYGHGSTDAARAALRAGAEGLCVALVDEGLKLRKAGLAAPILLLSEQPLDRIDDVVAHRLTPTVYTPRYIRALAEHGGTLPVHINIDTGMQRVGVGHEDLTALIDALGATNLQVGGTYTHLACADEPASPANALQLERFDRALATLRRSGLDAALEHAGNSGAALAIPDARRSFVRVGIAMYGISPGAGLDDLCGDLRPALSLHARVSYVKRVEAGSSVSYGWRHRFDQPTTVVTVPIGYADGVPRRLGTLPDRAGADVLIGGRRHRIVGVVTMDQFMVDVGDADVTVGDEVVLIGQQGDEQIRAGDWADRLGTIGYEIVCGISARVPRLVRGRSNLS